MNNTAYTTAIRSIKTAILRSRYRAATLANGELLSLYFSVGGYISANSREDKWGTNAIAVIAEQLQKELPGLRGFSATNMKYMRLFYEAWMPFLKSPVATGDLMIANRHLQVTNLQPPDDEHIANRSLPMNDLPTVFPLQEFCSTSFTQHCELIYKAKDSARRQDP